MVLQSVPCSNKPNILSNILLYNHNIHSWTCCPGEWVRIRWVKRCQLALEAPSSFLPFMSHISVEHVCAKSVTLRNSGTHGQTDGFALWVVGWNGAFKMWKQYSRVSNLCVWAISSPFSSQLRYHTVPPAPSTFKKTRRRKVKKNTRLAKK